MSVVKYILEMKIQMLIKVNKIGECSYQMFLFVARKNPLLEKVKNFTILINLNWIKSLTNFYWRGKFKPELHLKQAEFTYSACGPFTKHLERIQKFTETGNFKNTYTEVS